MVGCSSRHYLEGYWEVHRKYERIEKIMPSFEYEPLVLSPKLETSNEEEKKGDTNGATPQVQEL
jgi:hypothetical protein